MWVDPTTAWAQTSGRETFEGSGGAGLRGLWGPVSGHLSKSGWSVVLSCVRKGPFKRVQGGPYCMRYFSPDHRTLGSNLRAILAWNIPFFLFLWGSWCSQFLCNFRGFFHSFFLCPPLVCTNFEVKAAIFGRSPNCSQGNTGYFCCYFQSLQQNCQILKAFCSIYGFSAFHGLWVLLRYDFWVRENPHCRPDIFLDSLGRRIPCFEIILSPKQVIFLVINNSYWTFLLNVNTGSKPTPFLHLKKTSWSSENY